MINPGDMIKHNAAMDVAVQVINANRSQDGDYSIQGIWFNMGQAKTYSINELADFTIKKDQVQNWKKIIGPISEFVRNDNWEQVK